MKLPPACQTTIAREISLSGVGLHTGTTATLTFKPAEAGSGYVIIRTDRPDRPAIHPRADRVSQTRRGTTLCENGIEVHTVEHVLAALAGLGIDNCQIELNGIEPPIRDGSSRDFVRALQEVGVTEISNQPRTAYRLDRVLEVREDGKSIVAWPHEGLRITYELAFDHPRVKPQRLTVDVTPDFFSRVLADARTFCFEQEIEWLKSQGLARGGSLDNAVVIGSAGVLNEGGLRSEGELAYHKILDFIGDLALSGAAVYGSFVATKSGHALNSKLAQLIRKERERADHAQRGNSAVLIDINEIQALLPHRYPFLLVDRIIDFEDRKRVVGIKNVTINEPFFQGHFPGHPIMPGVLIVEAMAQCGGVLLLKTVSDAQSKVVYFVKIDNVKFRKPVLPGDQLRFELEVVKLKEKIAQMHGQAFVGEDLVCEADLMSTIVDR
jgi:UDP-3-O-[3-hydroxymyristoyl] N-acetylglucosamine deacetylase / 3-hydroxyacyl-[acyl-carrier-protein] dehydratase